MPRRRRTKAVPPTPQPPPAPLIPPHSLNTPNPSTVPSVPPGFLNTPNSNSAPSITPVSLNIPSLNSESDPNEIFDEPDSDEVCDYAIFSRASKRRSRRNTRKRYNREMWEDLLSEPGIFSSGALSAFAPAQPKSDESHVSLSARLSAAIEQVWGLEWDTEFDESLDINDQPPFSVIPDPSDLGQIAEHASLMLDVFSRVKPTDDQELTTVQKRLVTSAFSSVSVMTQQLRVLDVSLGEGLEPPQATQDDALNVYSGCVVCFERVADMLLMPCRHLSLCEVCCGKIAEAHTLVWGIAQKKPTRCPICRNNVLDQVNSLSSLF